MKLTLPVLSLLPLPCFCNPSPISFWLFPGSRASRYVCCACENNHQINHQSILPVKGSPVLFQRFWLKRHINWIELKFLEIPFPVFYFLYDMALPPAESSLSPNAASMPKTLFCTSLLVTFFVYFFICIRCRCCLDQVIHRDFCFQSSV